MRFCMYIHICAQTTQNTMIPGRAASEVAGTPSTVEQSSRAAHAGHGAERDTAGIHRAAATRGLLARQSPAELPQAKEASHLYRLVQYPWHAVGVSADALAFAPAAPAAVGRRTHT